MCKHGLARLLKRRIVVQTTRVQSQRSSEFFQALVQFVLCLKLALH